MLWFITDGAFDNGRVRGAHLLKGRGGEAVSSHVDDVVCTGDNVQIAILVRIACIASTVVACKQCRASSTPPPPWSSRSVRT